MNYLAIALNHFKAIQNWQQSSGADASLNVLNFELEVRCQQRYYKLFPQFFMLKEGRYIYSPFLNDDVAGFIGWLPYRPLSWSPANDKLSFKKFIDQHSERTPRFWDVTEMPPCDYIIKNSLGSFGDGLIGPLRASQQAPHITSSLQESRGIPFAEEFIRGEILKVWFWGKQPIYAQRRTYPEICGDGRTSLKKLLEDRLFHSGKTLSIDDADHSTLLTSLRYQNRTLDEIPAAGARIWLDYRYGRNYMRSGMRTTTDNALPEMTQPLIDQVLRVGEKVHAEAERQFSVPLLFSVDAVIDADSQIWWLEANSNPTLPPDGYPHIFASLFGTPVVTPSLPSDSEISVVTV